MPFPFAPQAWYGYKLHLLVDADYELPVAFEVTKASASEVKQAHRLIDKLKESRQGGNRVGKEIRH
jgi:hypothetical protein